MNIELKPDELVNALLQGFSKNGLCILDSCGGDHTGSQRLYAGVLPEESLAIEAAEPNETLGRFDEILAGDRPAVFTISYDLGRKLEGSDDGAETTEPDLFVSTFDSLLVHDYRERRTWIAGRGNSGEAVVDRLRAATVAPVGCERRARSVRSNFSREYYIASVEKIREHIRRGDTYQTNLTQQITVEMPDGLTTTDVYARLRRNHPSPFSAYIERSNSTVVSISPERFFRVSGRGIEASPIKGTRPRGKTATEDDSLQHELLESEKDRAENTMIVDLMRNDLGRVCEYGSVSVRELCALQTLPTLFHLVSTVEGRLRDDAKPSEILRALFPCGSITGAPKIRTMQIIDEIEPDPRGLSMGAIGIYIPEGFGLSSVLDLSVAIRTMVIRNGTAMFNVGGGIVIDSEPEAEYAESLLKAKALLDALGASVDDIQTPLRAREQFETSAV